QAEDGIRYRNVTGVQTCALPIWHLHAWSGSNIYLIRSSPSTTTGSSKNILRALSFNFSETCPPSRASMVSNAFLSMNGRTSAWRSEERRVGKEQMHGWTVDHGNK